MIESEYRSCLVFGEADTTGSGAFSAANVDVSLPTAMHRIGNNILKEMMPAPCVLANPKYYFGLVTMRFRRKRKLREGVLLAMPRHHNFFHWMVEILPRLMFYDRCPRLQLAPLIVPKSAPPFVGESLRLAGYGSKAMFLPNGVYRFEKLHMLSTLVRTIDVSVDAVEWLNSKFGAPSLNTQTPRRIYVFRSDAKNRYVSNEPQLANVLSDFGFTTLAMWLIPLSQVRLHIAAALFPKPEFGRRTGLGRSRLGACRSLSFCDVVHA